MQNAFCATPRMPRRLGRQDRTDPKEGSMSRRDLIDPESRQPLDQLLAAMPGGFNAIPDIVARRDAAAQMLAAIEVPPNENVTHEDRVVPGPAGAPDISVRVY